MSQTTLARPYAQAAFEYAAEQKKIAHWSNFLRLVSEYTETPFVASVIKDPQYDIDVRVKVLSALAEETLEQEGYNFIQLLSARHRLNLLPDIYFLFQQLCIAAEKVLPVQIKTASELDEQQKERLNAKLTHLLHTEIKTDYSLDRDLLGGFVVYAGDRVMDCSIKGRLQKLSNLYV